MERTAGAMMVRDDFREFLATNRLRAPFYRRLMVCVPPVHRQLRVKGRVMFGGLWPLKARNCVCPSAGEGRGRQTTALDVHGAYNLCGEVVALGGEGANLLWSFQGRIGRAAYAGGNVLVWTLAIAVVAVFAYLGSGKERPYELLAVVLPFFLVVLMAWSQFALAAKRFHDLGTTGLASLLLLVPLVGLIVFFYLLFARGEEQDNQYGLVAASPHGVAKPLAKGN